MKINDIKSIKDFTFTSIQFDYQPASHEASEGWRHWLNGGGVTFHFTAQPQPAEPDNIIESTAVVLPLAGEDHEISY